MGIRSAYLKQSQTYPAIKTSKGISKTMSKRDKIQVWLAYIPPFPDLSKYRRFLNDKEFARAMTFSHPFTASRFIVSRALTKMALSAASEIGRQPHEWHITARPDGKPVTDKAVHFNLSHADDLAAVAVSKRHCLGIDIEPLDQKLAIEDIEAVITKEEREEITKISPSFRNYELIRLWTLKESYLKLLGLGLKLDPCNILARLAPPGIVYDRGRRVDKSVFAVNPIIDVEGRAFSLSLTTWLNTLKRPLVSFHLFDPDLCLKSRIPHLNRNEMAKLSKEEGTWNDYIICSSSAVGPTSIELQ